MTHNGKNEKEKSTLSKAVALMEKYKKDGLNKIGTSGEKERPDSMDDFLNYADDLGIKYNDFWLKPFEFNSNSGAELNGIFKELSKKRDNKDS